MAVVAEPAPAPAPAPTLDWTGRQTIPWAEGWAFIKDEVIPRLKNLIERKPDAQGFSSDDYCVIYTIVYNMITQKPPHDYSKQLYDGFSEIVEEYLKFEVLPSLKINEFMLEELVQRWSNHKKMVVWLTRFFHYLERYYIRRRSLCGLKDVAMISFQQLIYKEIKGKINYVLIATIKKKPVEQIDTFLKEVLDTFDEIKSSAYIDFEDEDFEHNLLKVTKDYCMESQKWIAVPYPHYIIKAEEYSEQVELGDQLKSFKEIQYFLFTQQYPKQVLEEVLFTSLCDGKAEDLSKTYRYFESRDNIKELEEVFGKLKERFSKHLWDKVGNLRRQAKDSTSNKKSFRLPIVLFLKQVEQLQFFIVSPSGNSSKQQHLVQFIFRCLRRYYSVCL